MRIIADFHFHSKYSRATSKDMNVDAIANWAKWKGINLLGTGDFTHPLWFSELKQKLESLDNGLFASRQFPAIKYLLTAELSSIYTQGGRVRKVHNLIFAPSLETVQSINDRLTTIGNLYSDGRPILGLPAKDLAKLVFDIDPRCLIIPAHAWTPWFSVFGSNSGFDSLEECFDELTPKIHAIETGLSSDPEMNWRLSKLDPITLISCSDAHSPANLGREATVFDVADNADVDYTLITQMIKNSRGDQRSAISNKLDYTIEFFPEEGKYHFDGHRLCENLSLHPQESKKLNKICPKCGKPLTIGVMHRVEDLADREVGYQPENFPSSKHLVPLQEIIAETYSQMKGSRKVQEEYQRIVNQVGNEFDILLYKPLEELSASLDPRLVEGIGLVREGKVQAIPGYDGVYGIVKVFGGENEKSRKEKQAVLF